ncbi:MAG TPA: aldo/keto reductase [Acidimicrobiia bacterium]|nr:aldo/keto reductase [Acidimicrobiia bacterium]
MRTGHIGGLEVSVIGLGCNNFGRSLDQEQSVRVVEAALDAGITFFDTARTYGGGRSESFLAAGLGGSRDQVVIATKFGPVPRLPGSGSGRPGQVREAIERSLAELRTEWVDLYQLHSPDSETPIDDTLAALTELVDEGKVRAIGCCNFDSAGVGDAHRTSKARSHAGFVSNQVEYSLLHRQPESNGLIKAWGSLGVCLLPYYPLGNGLLTGKTRRGETPTGRLATDRYQRYLTDANFDLIDRLEVYSLSRGVTMAQVALAWLLSQQAVPAVTPGASTPEQVRENARGAEWHPSPEDLVALESVLDGGQLTSG